MTQIQSRHPRRRSRAALAVVAVALSLHLVEWRAGGSLASRAAAGPPRLEGTDPFNWGLNLPERPVPRRISRHFAFKGPEPVVLGEMEGPGCIRRIWITGRNIGREVILRIYFDGQPVPYVETPLGDFFGAMHNLMATNYPHDHTRKTLPAAEAYRINTPFLAIKPKNGFTAYLPMPFAKSARMELVGSERPTNLYCLIDWHEYPEQQLEEPLRFSARWRREAPVRDYADDFLMLDADGPGRLIGFVYGVDMLKSRHEMRWSHAGADNIYIDGDGEHPAFLRGIGGEDTFGTSYSGGDYLPQTSLYSDLAYYVQKDDEGERQKLVGYRFFVNERIEFQRSLHLRFGARSHDVASVVYWYSASAVRPFYKMPPVEQRLPGSEVRRGEYDLPLADTGQWWVAGPFETDFRELPDSGIDVGEGKAFGGASWQKHAALRGFVEFNHVYRPEATNRNSPTLEASAMARTTLHAPRATTARLTLGWSDRAMIRVNDDEPIDLGQQRYMRGRTIEVDLNQGANAVTVWLRNGPQEANWDRGAWNFSFRAVTREGEKLVPRVSE